MSVFSLVGFGGSGPSLSLIYRAFVWSRGACLRDNSCRRDPWPLCLVPHLTFVLGPELCSRSTTAVIISTINLWLNCMCQNVYIRSERVNFGFQPCMTGSKLPLGQKRQLAPNRYCLFATPKTFGKIKQVISYTQWSIKIRIEVMKTVHKLPNSYFKNLQN